MRFFIGIIIILGAIQLIRPAKNISSGPQPNDITVKYHAPADVTHLLHVACYDCHSNNTRYPWYANIEPAGWYLANHVNSGKRHLNFSEIGAYSGKKAVAKLDHAVRQVRKHGMPLGPYLLLHPDARLTPAQIKLLSGWLESVRESYPISDR